MTDKCMCTKFGAALLVVAGASLFMAQDTLGQTVATKGVVSRSQSQPTAIAQASRRATIDQTRADAMKRAGLNPEGGIAGPTSDCCVPHPTPGCDDPDCTALICGADAFCCDVEWDSICANAALAGCAVCATGGTCPPSANDCCAPSPDATPGCNDPACCDIICAADPFCCNVQWDGLCSGAAAAQCPQCAGGGCPASDNDCCLPSPTGTPGCNDPACCDIICAADPFCCDVAWDGLCSGAALTQCPQCASLGCPKGQEPPVNDDCSTAFNAGVIAPGGSFTFHGNNLCATPDCAAVGGAGQGNVWLSFTITEAKAVRLSYCGSTGVWGNAWLIMTTDGSSPVVCPPSANDCCAPSPDATPGCSDPSCCSAVCAADPFCCDVQWDGLCSGAALTVCAVCGGSPPTGCCASTSPIASFAFSCPDGNVEMLWANLPAGTWYYPVMLDAAFGSTGEYRVTIESLGPPENDDCADRIAIGEVCQMPFDTIGATTDGPAHVACEDGFADQLVNQDIWYNYTPTCSGDVTVSLCGSAYDTKLAVYDGCTCDLSDANLIDCEDDTCGLQSSITFAATAGNCYKIRVGGFGGATGSGQLTITNSGVPCGSDCVSDVDNNGVTNVDDLLIIINGWGPCNP